MELYNFTDPVFDPRMFKGRQEEKGEILEGVRVGDSYAIIGGTRIGKTSLLFELKRILLEELEKDTGCVIGPVFLSTHQFTDLSQTAIYRQIIQEFKIIVCPIKFPRLRVDDRKLFDPGITDEEAFPAFVELLESIVQAVSADLKIVILIDEVDELQRHEWSKVFFNNLRHLISQTPLRHNIAMVIAGTLAIYSLYKVAGSPFLNVISGTKSLKLLSPAETAELVNEPTDDQIDQAVIDHIYHQTGGHPFLIQYLMKNLCRKFKADLTGIKPEHVDQMVEKFMDERTDFENWASKFSEVDKQVYRLIASREEGVKKFEIVQMVGDAEHANTALDLLEHTGVIREAKRNIYVIGGEMFKMWFQENVSDPGLTPSSVAGRTSAAQDQGDAVSTGGRETTGPLKAVTTAYTDEPSGVREQAMTLMREQAIVMARECPRCGRCYPEGTERCEGDQSALLMFQPMPHVIDGKYRLDWLIGRGGMGAVYQATDLVLRRQVAVKMVRPDLLTMEGALERFRREAQIAARLSHTNIIAVYEFGSFPWGGAYLVMELLRGQLLHNELEQHRRLSPQRVATIMRQVCAAVSVAHQAGIIHRDLKPSNVMLCKISGDEEIVKLLDFGLAKRHVEQSDLSKLTPPTTPVGTIKYMSPEQARGEPVDTRTDIFALGVIVYRLLTGDHPFPGKTDSEIFDAIKYLPPRPLREIWPEAPASLEAVITRCLAKKPDDRYPTVAMFARELTQALSQIMAKEAAAPFDPEAPTEPIEDRR
jgi:tRNA A-37 threonylcarbamoyl transferase component Bud32